MEAIMAGTDRLLKIMERDTPFERAAADRIVGRLNERSDAENVADNWLGSGYRIVFEEMGDDPSRFFHDQKIFMVNTDAAPDEAAEALARNGKAIAENYARLRLESRFFGITEKKAERLCSLIDGICADPSGRAALNSLADKNTFICFTSEMPDGKNAEFESKNNIIFLKNEASDKDLAESFLACSKEAVAYAERPKTEVLKSAFNSKTPEEQAAFDMLIDTAYQAPIGKEMLDKLAGLKYDISFDDLSASKAAGVCNSRRRYIIIDPKFSFESQLVTFIHEAEHALQGEIYSHDLSDRNLHAADFIKKERAAEADACAHESLFVWQMRDIRPAVYASESWKGTTAAFIDEMKRSGNETKAMEKSFQAWYDSPSSQKFYEDSHAKAVERRAKWGENNQDYSCFDGRCSEDEILKGCLFNGAPYVNPEFLASENACALSDKTHERIQKALSHYAETTGRQADDSLALMPSREFVQQKKNFISSAGCALEQKEDFKAFVDAVAKLPQAMDIMQNMKGMNLWFENTGENAEKIRYMREADTVFVDTKNPEASAQALAEQCMAIRACKTFGWKGDSYIFQPSLDMSPEKEAEHLKRLVSQTEQMDPEAQKMHERMRRLKYTLCFERIAGGKGAVTVEHDMMRKLVIDPSLPLEKQAEGMLGEMHKAMERHADELPVVDMSIQIPKDAAARASEPAPKLSLHDKLSAVQPVKTDISPARERADIRSRLDALKASQRNSR